MEMSLEFHVLILLVLCNCGLTIGEVTLYPSGTVLVCDGGQLEFICSITDNYYLQWSIAVPTDDNRTDFNVYTWLLTVYDYWARVSQLSVSSAVMLTFSVISPRRTLPLSSRLLISPVIDNLNGTEVTCDPLTSISSHSATISIIDNSTDSQGFNITSLSEQFESQDVLVTLQLELIMLNVSIYSYQVTVVPQLNIVYSERDRFIFQLNVSYDIPYNVTVESSQCAHGQTVAGATATTVLYYSCDHPSAQLNDSQIMIIGYDEISIGITVTLSCPTGLVLTGPNSSTCMGNGEWEPNPREAECKVNCGDPPSHPVNGHIVPYTNTLEGAVVTYVCWTVYQEENISLCAEINTTAVCNNNGIWELDSQDRCSVFSETAPLNFEAQSKDRIIAVTSSVTAFIVTAILFFVTGFLSRYLCQKRRKTDDDHHVVKKEIPIYDDIIVLKEQGQELELKENVAYAPVR